MAKERGLGGYDIFLQGGDAVADGAGVCLADHCDAALPAGTNVIGHAIIDSGSTTAVTQATATNLNAAVVGTGTAGSPAGNILTVQGVASMTKLLVTPDSVALPANQSVNVAQINGVTTQMGAGASGTGTQRVITATDSTIGTLTGGGVAHDGVDSGNPVKIGGRAISAEITAVANNDRSDFITDLVGKQIILPYANPENFVSGTITTAMTGTTSTSLIAAPGAGLRNYITQITVSNSHATVGTDLIIQDGSGGTTLYVIPAAAAYGGAAITFPTPLRQPTANTALFIANVTTGSNTKASASGYKGQ